MQYPMTEGTILVLLEW